MKTALPVYRPARKTEARYRIIYGGAGSGKSVFVAQDEMDRAWNDPRQRILVLRKVKNTIYNSCFELFKKILSATNRLAYTKVNEQRMSLTFPGGGQIIHAGLDDTEKLKSITGVTRIWIEEGTELDFAQGIDDEPDIAQVDLRLRGVEFSLVPQLTVTFNPKRSAQKIFDYLGFPITDLPTRSFIERDDVFVQHTTYLDNKHVDETYVRVFRRLGGVMQAIYERGELVTIDMPDQVIPYEYVKRAFELDPMQAVHDGRQRLGIDVARFGDDETVFQLFDGWALVETQAFHGQDTKRTSELAKILIQERGIPADLVAVDVVGLGAGVADNLRDDGYDVVDVTSGASPVDVPEWEESVPEFRDLRSQMWFFGRDMMEAGKVSIATPDGEFRRKLQEDLLAPRYRVGQERRIEVEPKIGRSKNWGIKQRLGRSTDYADPFLYGLFAEHMQDKLQLYFG